MSEVNTEARDRYYAEVPLKLSNGVHFVDIVLFAGLAFPTDMVCSHRFCALGIDDRVAWLLPAPGFFRRCEYRF